MSPGLARPWRWSRSSAVNDDFCRFNFLYGLTLRSQVHLRLKGDLVAVSQKYLSGSRKDRALRSSSSRAGFLLDFRSGDRNTGCGPVPTLPCGERHAEERT
jgi:hypothetical protein